MKEIKIGTGQIRVLRQISQYMDLCQFLFRKSGFRISGGQLDSVDPCLPVFAAGFAEGSDSGKGVVVGQGNPLDTRRTLFSSRR